MILSLYFTSTVKIQMLYVNASQVSYVLSQKRLKQHERKHTEKHKARST